MTEYKKHSEWVEAIFAVNICIDYYFEQNYKYKLNLYIANENELDRL